MMDNGVVPETMAEVNDQVAMMKGRGFEIPVEEVIRETLKRGLQDMFDEKLDGNYFSVQWNEANFDIFGLGHSDEGHIVPKGESFVEDFKTNAANVWDYLDDESQKIVGR
jgi:hypothetical protein